ncbi:hypothetical protein KCU89_g39, partial [Aureobasidium melanogenum]
MDSSIRLTTLIGCDSALASCPCTVIFHSRSIEDEIFLGLLRSGFQLLFRKCSSVERCSWANSATVATDVSTVTVV